MTNDEAWTRDRHRRVAMELMTSMDRSFNNDQSLTGSKDEQATDRHITQTYRMARMHALLALSASVEGAASESVPTTESVPETDVQAHPRESAFVSVPDTYTYRGITYNLRARYRDREGDVWEFHRWRACGMPEMIYNDSVRETLGSVIEDYGLLEGCSTPDTQPQPHRRSDHHCTDCGERHDVP